MAQVPQCPALDFPELSKPGDYATENESKGTGCCAAQPPHLTSCFGVVEAPSDVGARGQCFTGMRALILFLIGRRQTSQISQELSSFQDKRVSLSLGVCGGGGDDDNC